jgi:parallel beta-helix repeat protein
MDGIDFDVTTASSLAMDNTCSKNIRYGIFTEEGANLNHLIRNSCNSNEMGFNLYSSATNNTIRNTLVANTCTANQRGIRFGAASPWETSQNFAFNNQIYDSTSFGIDSQARGSANYLSQNFFSGNAANLGSTSSAVYFNPPVANRALALTYTDWTARYVWYGIDTSLTADPNANGSSNLLDYALGQNPLAPASPILPVSGYDGTTPNGPWVTLTYRHNKTATDLTYETWSSPDLTNWTLQSMDGSTVVTETIHPDVDGDGATELWRTRIKLGPTETKRFLRLQIRKN